MLLVCAERAEHPAVAGGEHSDRCLQGDSGGSFSSCDPGGQKAVWSKNLAGGPGGDGEEASWQAVGVESGRVCIFRTSPGGSPLSPCLCWRRGLFVPSRTVLATRPLPCLRPRGWPVVDSQSYCILLLLRGIKYSKVLVYLYTDAPYRVAQFVSIAWGFLNKSDRCSIQNIREIRKSNEKMTVTQITLLTFYIFLLVVCFAYNISEASFISIFFLTV